LDWVAHAVVGFFAGWGLALWRGTVMGKAQEVYSYLENDKALRSFLKGEVARRGGLDALAKGIKRDELLNQVVDEMFSRLDTLNVTSLVAEYGFYVILAGAAFLTVVGDMFSRGTYLSLIGIPVCFLTAKQVAKQRGEPAGDEMLLRLFGLFHFWLKHQPVDAFGYAKSHKAPLKNLVNVLRESGAYAL
jgi:hypothetical protein